MKNALTFAVACAVLGGAARADSAAADDPKELIARLESRFQSDRDHAVAQIVKLGGPVRKGLVGELVKLVQAGKWQGLQAAAEVLGAMGPDASAAAAPIQKAVPGFVEDKRRAVVEVLLATLRKIDPAAGKAIVADVAKLLARKDPTLQAIACEALGTIGKDAKPAEAPLLAVLKGDDAYAAAAAAKALGKVGAGKEAVAALAATLDGKDRDVAWAAVGALEGIGPGAADALPALAKLPHSREAGESMVLDAIRAMGAVGPKAVPALIDAMSSRARGADRAVAEVLKGMGADAVEPLTLALAADDKSHALNAARLLLQCGQGGEKKAMAFLAETIKGTDVRAAGSAGEVLARIGPSLTAPALRKQAVEALIAVLGSKAHERTHDYAIAALGEFGPEAKDALPALQEIAGGKSKLADRAKSAIEEIRAEKKEDKKKG